MTDIVIRTQGLKKTYTSGTNEVHALRGIVGRSGHLKRVSWTEER